jgi:hypothetical protein
MNRIQFERKKRKKTYLIPLLLVVLLLYITIPVFLINKGSDLLVKANERMSQSEVYSPTVEFYNGIAFLNTAAAFPGFGSWSKSVEKTSIEKMIKSQDAQFEKLCLSFLKKEMTAENAFPDSSEVVVGGRDVSKIFVKSFFADSSSTSTITLNDSILNKIDSLYCKNWEKFFDKTKMDKANLFSICKK